MQVRMMPRSAREAPKRAPSCSAESCGGWSRRGHSVREVRQQTRAESQGGQAAKMMEASLVGRCG